MFGAGDVSSNAQSGAMGIAAGVGMIYSSILGAGIILLARIPHNTEAPLAL